MSDDCTFCKIVKGDVPSHKIWEDDKHLAMLSIYPNTSGFTVVLTKEHKPSYAFDNNDETLKGIVLATKQVAKLLDKAFDDVGRCGMFFEGFGVDHLHSKLFPMHGTGNMANWKPIDSEIKDMVFDIYPGFLASNNGPRANDEELAELAERIRSMEKKS
jgi:histidine triad (HIT) family protein